MKQLVTIIVVSLLAGACNRVAQDSPSEGVRESNLDLLFIANEGVLVQAATKKVLIDAIFTDPHPDYTAPPSEMLVQMESGHAPFDDVNLVLVTHNHADHFNPSAGGRFLNNNSQAVLLAPEDAVATLRDSVSDWTSISDRVVPIALDLGMTFERSFDGIAVTAYRTLHSGNRETPQNLMYLIEMDGRTIFHEGDSDGNPETFNHFGLGEEHIDLALVHFWFPTNPEAEGILQGILRADHVGLFHLPKSLMDDAPETIAQVSDNYPDMFLLLTPGERISF
jgi:L-ascorbate metabolism protein UlaG (beta-lactamase superfamily)